MLRGIWSRCGGLTCCRKDILSRRLSSSTSTESLRRIGSRSLGQTYMYWLETHPLKTKSVTSGLIAGLGDLLCQVAIENKSITASEEKVGHEFGWRRLFTFTALGGLYLGPVLHIWYGALGRVLPGSAQLAVAKRLAADQLIFAPAFIPSFMSLSLILQGKISEVPDKLAEEWWPTVRANWAVWVPAQYINFAVVPPQFQVLFSNCVGLVWHVYLSNASHRELTSATVAI